MIRDANESDLPCLAEAMVRIQKDHVEAFPDIYRPFNAGEALSYLSVVLSRPDAVVRVAVHEGAVVGHVVFFIETRPESMFTNSQRYGHITQIDVEPDFRRRGYGQSLLVDCERLAAAHGLRRIVLDVWAFNHSAKSFFQALGYADFGSKMSRSV
jgi:ribosomal protein S18 acetylase RimI-like enzyme